MAHFSLFHHHPHKAYHPAHGFPDDWWQKLAWAFFAALALLYGLGHGSYLLFDVDEAIFTEASVEMVQRNNFVVPTYNAEPRYHKPPLIYWAQSLGLKLEQAVPYAEGKTEQAVRLVSGFFAWLAVLVFYLTLLKLTHRYRLALTATMVFGLNLSWLVVARAATADAALNFFILASTGWLLHMLYNRKGGFWRQLLAGLLLGLGLLAKGPIAGVVPFVVIGMGGLFRPQLFQSLRLLNPLVILPAMVLTISPWIVSVIQATGMDFFKEFILVHNLGRFEGDLGNTQSHSAFYYLLVLLLGFFPWSLMLLFAWPLGVLDAWKKLRSTDAATALPVLALLWCVSIVALFSFSGTKLAHYIVPALPGAAILVAFWLDNLTARRGKKYVVYLAAPIVLALAGVFLSLNRLLIAARPGVADPLLQNLPFPWPPEDELAANVLAQVIPLNIAPYAIAVILIVGMFFGLFALKNRARQGIFVVGLAQYLWLSLVIAGVLPVVSAYVQRPLATAAGIIADRVTPETQVIHYGLHKPSVRLISGVPFTQLHKPVQFGQGFGLSHALVLGETHRIGEVEAILPADTPHKKACTGGYCVLEVQPTESTISTEQEEAL